MLAAPHLHDLPLLRPLLLNLMHSSLSEAARPPPKPPNPLSQGPRREGYYEQRRHGITFVSLKAMRSGLIRRIKGFITARDVQTGLPLSLQMVATTLSIHII